VSQVEARHVRDGDVLVEGDPFIVGKLEWDTRWPYHVWLCNQDNPDEMLPFRRSDLVTVFRGPHLHAWDTPWWQNITQESLERADVRA
jgi:hypothetical protein